LRAVTVPAKLAALERGFGEFNDAKRGVDIGHPSQGHGTDRSDYNKVEPRAGNGSLYEVHR
jgi:hypothetical protein